MRILGTRMRAYRKARGLSQAALAKDICTQATISLIEKRNKIPSMQILMKLCARLGISINDIIVENNYRLGRMFREIGKAIRERHYRTAEARLDTIKFNTLKENDEFKAYYYFRGEVQLANHRNTDEAIFNFGMLLNQFGGQKQDMYMVMGRLGLGLAYMEKQAFDKADILVEQAVADLAQFEADGLEAIQNQLRVLLNAASFFQKRQHATKALKLVDSGIKLSMDNSSFYLLEELFEVKAMSQLALKDKQSAQRNLYVAYALATISNNERLVKQVYRDAAANNIPPLTLSEF